MFQSPLDRAGFEGKKSAVGNHSHLKMPAAIFKHLLIATRTAEKR